MKTTRKNNNATLIASTLSTKQTLIRSTLKMLEKLSLEATLTDKHNEEVEYLKTLVLKLILINLKNMS